MDEWASYRCQCQPGYEGSFCEKQVSASFVRNLQSSAKFGSSDVITSFSIEFSVDVSAPTGPLAYTSKGVSGKHVFLFKVKKTLYLGRVAQSAARLVSRLALRYPELGLCLRPQTSMPETMRVFT